MEIKYVFRNIGTIEKAEMELGDLTVIAGKNNTGKTYLAYSLYGFLQFISRRGAGKLSRFIETLGNSVLELEDPGDIVSEMIQHIVMKEEGLCEIVLSYEKLDQYLKREVARYARRFSREISTEFSAPSDQFKGAGVECLLDGQFEINQLTSSEEFVNRHVKSLKISAEKDFYRIEFRTSMKSKSGIRIIVANFLSYLFLMEKFPSAFILSSERFGISLFYKELDFTKNRIVEMLQNMSDKKHKGNYNRDVFILEKTSARYAKPIKDNIDFTRDLERIQEQKGSLIDNEFFNDIRDMMGGYYRYANNEIQFISKQRGQNRFDIPLHIASSSARGLSDLYFYLKHVAKKGELLIIDEPESHLDTANQILMARLLARCVNAGIKVLITTHSDYIVQEFNNLIMLSGDFEGKGKFMEKYRKEYTENDYLKPKSVKGYICENKQLTPCEVTKHGVNMPIFNKTINRINEIANTLILRLEE